MSGITSGGFEIQDNECTTVDRDVLRYDLAPIRCPGRRYGFCLRSAKEALTLDKITTKYILITVKYQLRLESYHPLRIGQLFSSNLETGFNFTIIHFRD